MYALQNLSTNHELDPMAELAVATEVLERAAAGTLEESLDDIVERIARAGGAPTSLELRQGIAGGLRGIARRVVPPLVAPAGQSLPPGLDVGRLLGLETEGLSPETAEFEAARQFVRLAAGATAQATASPGAAIGSVASREAVRRAVERFAPGLARGPDPPDRQHTRTKEAPVYGDYETGSPNGAPAQPGTYGEAEIYDGEAEVYGEADQYGEAEMYEADQYGEAEVYGEADQYGEAEVYGEADQYGEAEVYGEADQYGEAEMYETDQYGEAEVYGEADQYGETGGVGEAYGAYAEVPQPLSEVEEVNLASELLGVQSETELDQFIGKLLRSGARRLMRSPAGFALGNALKDAAKRVLPVAGAAIGTYLAPGIGGSIGSKLGADLASTFEAEAEGVDPETADFELARRYVRVASNAAKNLSATSRAVPPDVAARRALARAAGRSGAVRYAPRRRRRRSGRWVRRGNVIIVIGA